MDLRAIFRESRKPNRNSAYKKLKLQILKETLWPLLIIWTVCVHLWMGVGWGTGISLGVLTQVFFFPVYWSEAYADGNATLMTTVIQFINIPVWWTMSFQSCLRKESYYSSQVWNWGWWPVSSPVAVSDAELAIKALA